MVRAAGHPPGVLLDPCCGSGTILTEAISAGWSVRGTDIDRNAVETTRRNVPAAQIEVGDVRRIDLPDSAADACVSNLPFGRQYQITGDTREWLDAALGEMTRVTRVGGRVILLVPDIPRAAVPVALRLTQSQRLRLLGTSTRMWCYERL
jgi:tRNA G10  N-methylase Trm11